MSIVVMLNTIMPYLTSDDKELELGDQVSLNLNTTFNVAVILRLDRMNGAFDCEFPDGSVISVDEQFVMENLTGQLRKRKRFLHDVVDMLTDI